MVQKAVGHQISAEEAEAVVRRCSVEKVFLEISKNSQENTRARDSFLIKVSDAGVFQ